MYDNDFFKKIISKSCNVKIFNLPLKHIKKNEKKETENKLRLPLMDFIKNYVFVIQENNHYDEFYKNQKFKSHVSKLISSDFLNYDYIENHKKLLQRTYNTNFSKSVLLPYNSKIDDLEKFMKDDEYHQKLPFEILGTYGLDNYFFKNYVKLYQAIGPFKYYIFQDELFLKPSIWYKQKEYHTPLSNQDFERLKIYNNFLQKIEEERISDIINNKKVVNGKLVNYNTNETINNSKNARNKVKEFLNKSESYKNFNINPSNFEIMNKKRDQDNIILPKEKGFINREDNIVTNNINKLKIKNEIASKLFGRNVYGNVIIAVNGNSNQEIIKEISDLFRVC